MNVIPRTGFLFGRAAKALAIGDGSFLAAAEYAANRNWAGNLPEVLKAAAVSSGNLSAALGPVGSDLSEYLRPRTIVGRLPLARVPFQTRLLAGSVAASAAFVPEGGVIPVTGADLEAVSLPRHKVAVIAAMTKEVMDSPSPAADQWIAAELGRAVIEALDRQFLDPSVDGSAGGPASITNGGVVLPATGNIVADVTLMIETLVAAGMPLTSAYFVLHPVTAARLALLRDPSGAVFPGLTAAGGTLAGLPAITSGSMVTSGGSDPTYSIALVESDQVLIADDGETEIELAKSASLQMDDSGESVSLFQTNSIAVRCVRYVSWAARRPGAAVLLEGVA